MFIFPTHLFNPAQIKTRLGGISVTGGESLSGETDVIRTDGGGYWLIEMKGIELIKPDLIRAWRAWESELAGGVEKVVVPIMDIRQAPYVAGFSKALPAGSGDSYFPDIANYAAPPVMAQITVSAALRATEITVNVTAGLPLKGGEHFGIDHGGTLGWRLHRVRRVVSRPTATSAVIKIEPPLRGPITGTPKSVNFSWPMVVASLLPEADIAPDIMYGRQATVDIAFREAF